jgi:hypothetical protein
MRPQQLPPQPPRPSKPEEPPSYLWSMLTHPININLGLLSAAAATILSIPFGVGGGALPLRGFAAG